jgi:site-specific DNA-methyltransferase (adenine-specific)
LPELRLGRWQDVLKGVKVDALISDPPYSDRVHRVGALIEGKDDAERTVAIGYDSFAESDIEEMCSSWSPRVRSWMAIHTSHDLLPAWEKHLGAQGRYVFPPIPCVMRGMSVRLQGDGPSSWTCYLIVARPREKRFMKWGTLPGAYVGSPPSRNNKSKSVVMGQKPQWLIDALIRDYTRKGDLVCDPFTGSGTTGIACASYGRRFVGSELDENTYAAAVERLKGGQVQLFDE